MQTYMWDEIGCELRCLDNPGMGEEMWRFHDYHANGVREYRSDRNHVALYANARSMAEANQLMFAASEKYRDMSHPPKGD